MTYLGMAVTFIVSSLIVNIIWAGVMWAITEYRLKKLNKVFKEIQDYYDTKPTINDGWEDIIVTSKNNKSGKIH